MVDVSNAADKPTAGVWIWTVLDEEDRARRRCPSVPLRRFVTDPRREMP